MNAQETALRKTPEPAQRQPTATELSQQAIMLAQARKKRITSENREELLREAYELWRAAESLIRERESAAEKETEARESAAWGKIAAGFHREDTVTFKEMVEQKMLPRKSTGKKSEPFISSIEGAKKAFREFHKRVCGLDLARGESKMVGAACLHFLNESRADVLRTGAMSKGLSVEFLAWQRRRCGLESLSTPTL